MIIWEQGPRSLQNLFPRKERLFDAPPALGLVVGTFAAVPYIHLHLEARRRLYPDVPLLIHDDCSPKASEIQNLAREYDADFVRTAFRMPPCKGDLSAFVSGLAWSQERKVALLVKMSRRFLPLIDWSQDLQGLAMDSQYATYSSWTTSFNFGFRTECLGIAVEEWISSGAAREMVDTILAPNEPFVEGFMHGLARKIAKAKCVQAETYDDTVGHRPGNRDGYAVWPFMGTDRRACSPDFLWHDCAKPSDYAALAKEWGLEYGKSDFDDPNMRYGSRPS